MASLSVHTLIHSQFEKGRQETLVLHVTRNCHVITKEERHEFLHDITHTAPVPHSTIKQVQTALQLTSASERPNRYGTHLPQRLSTSPRSTKGTDLSFLAADSNLGV